MLADENVIEVFYSEFSSKGKQKNTKDNISLYKPLPGI